MAAPPRLCVAGLVALHAWLAVTSFSRWSLTFDETGQLTAGLSYLQTSGDFRVNSEQGLIPSVLMALPVYMSMNYTWLDESSDDWIYSQTFPLAEQFLHRQGNDFRNMAFRARLAMLLQPLFLICWIYLWSSKLNGTAGGILSASLAALSPTILAHGSLCTSDMAVTLWITVALKLLWASFDCITIQTFCLSSLALAAAFLSKMSALVLGPVAICLVFIRVILGHPTHIKLRFGMQSIRNRPAVAVTLVLLLLGQALVMAAVFWSAYLFKYEAIKSKTVDGRGSFPVEWEVMYNSTLPIFASATEIARNFRLLPEAFLYDFIHNMYMVSNRRAFFQGKYSRTGFPEYFLFCAGAKTPIPVLTIVVLALLWPIVLFAMESRVVATPVKAPRRMDESNQSKQALSSEIMRMQSAPILDAAQLRRRKGGNIIAAPMSNSVPRKNADIAEPGQLPLSEGRLPYAPLLVHVVVFWMIALRSKVTIGERYVLPSYPAIFVLVGSVLKRNLESKRIWTLRVIVVVILMFLTSYEVIMYRPNYIAYFNSLVGPDNAWRHVVDSSLDWGQDLPRLQEFFELKKQEDPSQAFYLSYFGTSNPRSYGIDAQALPSFPDLWRRNLPMRLTLDYYPGYYAISATMLWNLYSMFEFVGEWTQQLEEYYWEIFSAVAHGSRDAEVLFKADQGVFKRMCSYLQTERPPDFTIGYSILVYKLNETEISRFCYKREPRPSLPDNPRLIFTPLRPIA